jgi:uncharacterized protein (DUF427 family)
MTQRSTPEQKDTRGPSNRVSVWDFPRPPRLEATDRHIRVVAAGVLIADTRQALRLLETSHPPTYYLPPDDVRTDLLRVSERRSSCEFKGTASYYGVFVNDSLIENCAWTYLDPVPRYAALKDHLAFFAGLMDECWVGDELARPQPGGFYGGWITSDLDGPFKGGPGTWGW